MTGDRVLSWPEWRRTVLDTMRPRIEAIEAEVDAAIDAFMHPLGALSARRLLGAAKQAAVEGDADEVERLLAAIRWRIDQERAWAIRSGAIDDE